VSIPSLNIEIPFNITKKDLL